jgi:Ca2+-binding EF-hand superfamily protein
MPAHTQRISTRLRVLAAGSLLITGAALAQTGSAPPAPAATRPATSAAAPTTARPAAPGAASTPAGRPTAASPEQLFADWDKDSNKQLSFQEFKDGLEEARLTETIARLETQFRSADANRSGALEASEYADLPVIKRAGGGAPPLSAFDANKNMSLDFREYLVMVQAMIKRNPPPLR